jgi:hypothetical protein
MIKEVFKKMWDFFLIYMIGHLGFAEAYYFISASSHPRYQYVDSYPGAVVYSFCTALGEF